MWTGDRSKQIPFGQCKRVDSNLRTATTEVDRIELAKLMGDPSLADDLTGEVVIHANLFFPPPIAGAGSYLDPGMLDPHAKGLAVTLSKGMVEFELCRLLDQEAEAQKDASSEQAESTSSKGR